MPGPRKGLETSTHLPFASPVCTAVAIGQRTWKWNRFVWIIRIKVWQDSHPVNRPRTAVHSPPATSSASMAGSSARPLAAHRSGHAAIRAGPSRSLPVDAVEPDRRRQPHYVMFGSTDQLTVRSCLRDRLWRSARRGYGAARRPGPLHPRPLVLERPLRALTQSRQFPPQSLRSRVHPLYFWPATTYGRAI